MTKFSRKYQTKSPQRDQFVTVYQQDFFRLFDSVNSGVTFEVYKSRLVRVMRGETLAIGGWQFRYITNS